MAKFTLDEVDKKILRILQENGGISNLDLAKSVELAPSSCLLRVKNLKEYGLIKKTITIVDEQALGYQILAFLKVELKVLGRSTINDFVEAVKTIPQVTECYMTTGQGAFLLKTIAKDLQDYHDFVLDKLVSIPSVSNIETSIIINVEKHTNVVPIE